MKNKWLVVMWLIVFGLLVCGLQLPVEAAYGINRTINFQGKLVTSAGVNVPNSTPVTATFLIYESNDSCPGGGTAVWSENQTFTPVDGIFQVALGSVTPFGSSIDFSQDTLYLGIKISTETNEMCMGSSRIKLASVPQAFNAEQFAGLTADNNQTNYFTITGGQGTPATLKVDGNITVGPIISPTSAGGLTVQSNGANALTLDTGGNGAVNIGSTSATSVVIGRTGQTVQINTGTPATNGIVYSTNTSGTLAFTATGGVGTLCLQSTNGGTPAFGPCTVSISDWNLITNPTADLALTMGNNHTAFTWGTGTGATNMFDLKDTTGNTGTGYVLSATTVGTSAAKPFYVAAQGNTLIDTTGAGGLTFTSAGSSAISFDSGTTGNVNIGTGANAKTISIGTGAVANTITIGSSSATGVSITDNNWGVTTAGAATFTGLNLGTSSFASCDFLGTDSSGNATCSTNGFNVVTHKNDNNATWTDADTTDLWATTGELSISVSANSEVMVLSSFYTTAVDPGSQQVSLGARIDREGAGVASDCADNNDIGYMAGAYTDNANGDPTNIIQGNTTFVDTGTTAGGTFTYAVCVDAESTTIGGGVWVADAIDLTLIEVNDAGDLAEVYPTNDPSIEMAEVVSIDPLIEGGVARTMKAYDRNLLGVVTTRPALVIGGRGGQGIDGKPVALTGRVPVKVTTQNGVIKAGDALTSSNMPGVAMKATKAGPILGIAMREYSGQEVGSVLTFVKTGYFNGSNLAEIVEDPTIVDTGEVILNRIVQELPFVDSKSPDLSGIFTDRVVAGLEMVTPKLTADRVFTKDLAVSGAATVSGGLTADWIKANRIEGLDILARKYSILEDKVASVSAGLAVTPSPWPTSTDSPKQVYDLAWLESLLDGKTLTFTGPVTFSQRTTFRQTPEWSNDSGGMAEIKEKSDRVEIVFENEYLFQPIVLVNISNPETISLENDKKLWNDSVRYSVVEKTKKGFVILLDKPAKEDILFSWTAIAIREPKTFTSKLLEITPTPVPTLIPTLFPTPTETASPSGQTQAVDLGG